MTTVIEEKLDTGRIHKSVHLTFKFKNGNEDLETLRNSMVSIANVLGMTTYHHDAKEGHVAYFTQVSYDNPESSELRWIDDKFRIAVRMLRSYLATKNDKIMEVVD
ncbi:MAG: hypothetical protein ACXAD7_25380 [Candidatus Kariarchaeaceae archaeon]|jgi:hypothetical protein